MDRRRFKILCAAAIVAVGVAASAWWADSETASPSDRDVVGIWKAVDGSVGIMTFYDKGSFVAIDVHGYVIRDEDRERSSGDGSWRIDRRGSGEDHWVSRVHDPERPSCGGTDETLCPNRWGARVVLLARW